MYILKGKRPVRVKDIMVWAEKSVEQRKQQVVCQTDVDRFLVSTVFIGFSMDPHPQLFETMIFGEWVDRNSPWGAYRKPYGQVRYSTWKEAEAGHKAAVAMVKEALPKKKKKNAEDRVH